jgi:hypothetical protein
MSNTTDLKSVPSEPAPSSVESPRKNAVWDVLRELRRAREKFPNFNSPHEGYAIVHEEMDELWEVVKAHKGGVKPVAEDRDRMRSECVQIAAMALRFIEDVCDV